MEMIVRISESDYYAVMQWDDDGGNPCDVVYQFIPDLEREPKHATDQNTLKDFGGESKKKTHCKEAILAVKR
jgi:hypothetical protein